MSSPDGPPRHVSYRGGMDFAMSAKANDYHKRLSDFMTEHVFPSRGRLRQVPARGRPERPHRPADHRGTQGQGQRAWPVEPVPAGRVGPDQPGIRSAGRDHRLEPGDRSRGAQLRGARHRQHGDPAPVRHRGAAQAVAGAVAEWRDPQRLLDDRAGGRQQRRAQHRDLHRARRRRLRDQRPQVVDLRRGGPALQGPDRDGPHQPRGGKPPAAVDGSGADRHPRRDRLSVRRPSSATRTSPATARSSTTTSGCRSPTCSAKRAAASRSPRPGWARAASTTACARSAAPNARWP